MIKKAISLLLCLTIAGFCLSAASGQEGIMTPYIEKTDPDVYRAGATFDIPSDVSKDYITASLERMSSIYNINTITIYGLENLPLEIRDHIFNELDRLGMKIVVRVESYDPSEFAFTKADARNVLSLYSALLDYVSTEDKRDNVAYFAVNMPVDDPRVQANAGGLNSQPWQDAQVVYAQEIVRLLRDYLGQRGFTDARLYLSVHYGWDNSFKIPAYESAGADGYFINCYSYPAIHFSTIPTADAERKVLIDTPHIDECMRLYQNQYGDAPVVMEFGFHTMEYNNWVRTDQTAGLVWDRAAKAKAVQETISYYKEEYPFVEGALYFGFNLLKEEGSDNAVMDWCLEYPANAIAGWADAYTSGDAYIEGDMIVLPSAGSSVAFRDVPQLQEIVIRYSATAPVDIRITTNGRTQKTLTLPASDDVTAYPIPVVVVEGYELRVEHLGGGGLSIASLLLLENLEPEWSFEGALEDDDASGGLYVRGFTDKTSPISFYGVRGGESISVCYRADEDCILYIMLDGRTARFPLAASDDFTTAQAKLPVYRDADLSFYTDSESLDLDYIRLEGIPGVKR